MRIRLAAAILLMAGLGIFGASCGNDDNPNSPSGTVTIRIVDNNGNMSFSPEVANVRVGQTVEFANNDDLVHEIASDAEGVFDVGTIAPGTSSRTFTISTAGSVPYHCEIHPSMVGSLNVTN
jgi:plastocyanin